MALSKANIIKSIQLKNGLTEKRSTEFRKSIVGTIKDTLAIGETVLISDVDKFCIKEKAEREGRNPATGDDQILVAQRVVTFRFSGKLRERDNGT